MKKMKFLQISFLLVVLVCCTKKEAVVQEQEVDSDPSLVAQGCPNTEYDNWETSEYVLPFAVGESYMVDLSHCAGSYHSTGRPDQFAIDFAMPIGAPITAARNGRVVYVEESGYDGGFPNNVVIIIHEDNTFAQYMHLTRLGALVQVGDTIQQGQKIANSGSTGLAGYPHLHFVVTSGGYSYPYESIPTTFKNTVPNERSLVSWTKYRALPY